MAKTTNKPSDTTPAKKHAVPAGYSKDAISGDIIAFWDDTVAGICCIPQGYKLFDNDQDKEKVSTLFVVKLTAPLEGAYKKEKGEDKPKLPVQTKAGDVVGIWGSAGMRDLVNMGGMDIFIYQEGEKNTGKKSPMKLYHVHPKDPNADGFRLKCMEDGRKESKNGKLLWEKGGVSLPKSDTNGNNEDEDLDGLPMN